MKSEIEIEKDNMIFGVPEIVAYWTRKLTRFGESTKKLAFFSLFLNRNFEAEKFFNVKSLEIKNNQKLVKNLTLFRGRGQFLVTTKKLAILIFHKFSIWKFGAKNKMTKKLVNFPKRVNPQRKLTNRKKSKQKKTALE